jgi:hypothetical protein
MLNLLNGSITLKTFALGVPMLAMALGVSGISAQNEATDAPLAQAQSQAQKAAKPANPEEAGVRVALEAYMQGHITGQADAFRRAFQPEARMLSVTDGKLATMEIVDYIARAGTGKAAADEAQRKRTIDFIDISGDAAVARLTLDYPAITFTDYMTLLKINGEWRIVNKVVYRLPKAAQKPS